MTLNFNNQGQVQLLTMIDSMTLNFNHQRQVELLTIFDPMTLDCDAERQILTFVDPMTSNCDRFWFPRTGQFVTKLLHLGSHFSDHEFQVAVLVLKILKLFFAHESTFLKVDLKCHNYSMQCQYSYLLTIIKEDDFRNISVQKALRVWFKLLIFKQTKPFVYLKSAMNKWNEVILAYQVNEISKC